MLQITKDEDKFYLDNGHQYIEIDEKDIDTLITKLKELQSNSSNQKHWKYYGGL